MGRQSARRPGPQADADPRAGKKSLQTLSASLEDTSKPVYTSSAMPKRGSGGSTHAKVLHLSELQAVFHLPMAEAALKLGVCSTVLKKICRRNGISKWPYRQIRKIDKAVGEFEDNQASSSAGGAKQENSRRNRGSRHKVDQLLKLRAQIIKQPDVDHTTALECALTDERFNLEDMLNSSSKGPQVETGTSSYATNSDITAALFSSPADQHQEYTTYPSAAEARATFFDDFREGETYDDFGFSWNDTADFLALTKGETAHDLLSDPLFELLEESPAVPRTLKRPHEETLDPSQLRPVDLSSLGERKRPKNPTIDYSIGGPFDTEPGAAGVSVW